MKTPHSPDSDEEEPPGDNDDPLITQEDMKTTLQFIQMLGVADLES